MSLIGFFTKRLHKIAPVQMYWLADYQARKQVFRFCILEKLELE